jgi:hypothetical protein
MLRPVMSVGSRHRAPRMTVGGRMTEPPFRWDPIALPPRRRRPWLLLGLWSVVALPLAVALAFWTLRLWAGAQSDCGDFDAGNRFAVTVLYWPIGSVALWLLMTVPSGALTFIGRRAFLVGVVVGVVLAGAVCWSLAGSTRAAIAAQGFDAEICPAGLPGWWPAWAPR